jgi:hypothetical protein
MVELLNEDGSARLHHANASAYCESGAACTTCSYDGEDALIRHRQGDRISALDYGLGGSQEVCALAYKTAFRNLG